MNNKVENTEKGDLEFIYKLFDESVAYQERNGYHSWKNYDKNKLVKDIEDKNQYKIIIDATIAILGSFGF